MAFIIPTPWTRTEGYPKFEGNKEGTSLVDKFYTTYDITDILNKIPLQDSSYDEDTTSEQIALLKFSSYQIEPTKSKNHAFITLTYQPMSADGVGGGGGNEGVASYFLENGTLEKPIETFKGAVADDDYHVKWNYNLYEFIETTGGGGATPLFWSIAKNQSDATGESEEGKYAWSKEKPSGGYRDPETQKTYDWIKLEDMTKPGQESYIIPSPVVQERKFYNQKVSAESAGSKVGSILAPTETFGITGGEWLVMSATVQEDGRKYLVERSFQYAKDWDNDLYPTG